MTRTSIYVTVAAAVLLLTAGCGTNDPANAAVSGTANTAARASSTATPATTDAAQTPAVAGETHTDAPAGPRPDNWDVTAAMLGDHGDTYLTRVNTVWPLTTDDAVSTAGGYAIGVCAAKNAGMGETEMIAQTVPTFAREYNLTITPRQAAGIVDAAWNTICR
ncbi:hypothetical protein G4X40_21435 [Rhodococcus sp. D2-41]|uniref:hypothetical protein n=1 Tax=Speluncibacter jeojiensis TaxID=2710754 RepID=UPI00240FF45D|nr:hypothetical protein [Rhodococcus sp. D2-41]MDG3012706.1 hypothetical protein [Rhodococcus sp. D2-41]